MNSQTCAVNENFTIVAGESYRMPSGRVAKFVRQAARRNAFIFQYEDDGSPAMSRRFELTWENIPYLAPTVTSSESDRLKPFSIPKKIGSRADIPRGHTGEEDAVEAALEHHVLT